MSRKEIWTIGNRKWFERLMVLLFSGALGSWLYSGNAELVKALEAIVVFSVTGAFVVLAGGEAMLGVLAEIRRQQLEKGREEGRKEVLEWIREQEEAGVRFKEPPPYSPENQQLEKGREEGRKEVLEWIREQEEAGVQFKEPPPYSPESK